MNNILVSIIVPIYNVEKYLERCLLSIKEQTYTNIEVIMVNDGSKDTSRVIAEKYQRMDSRFMLVDKENGGLSSGRNYGMQYINGEYVSFVDSDDFLENDYVETLLRNFNNEIDIVIGDYVIYNASNSRSYLHGPQYDIGEYATPAEKKKLMNALFSGQQVMTVRKNMYRVSFLKKNKLEFVSERLVYAEDKLFHVEAYTLARKVKIIPDIVFYHLVVPGSLSQGYRKNHFEMSKELYSRIKALLDNNYDEKVIDDYCSKIPNIIGASMLNMCKCGFCEAKENMRNILEDSFVKESYKVKYHKTDYFRYWILYKIGNLGSTTLVVISAKLMLLSNPVYRFLQRKEEYKKINNI